MIDKKKIKSLKNIIIILIMIIVLISVILLYLLSRNESNDSSSTSELENNNNSITDIVNQPLGDNELIETEDTEFQMVSSSTMYYTVQECIQKYLTITSLNIDKNTQENIVDEDLLDSLNIKTSTQKAQAIYNLIDQEYISEKNISVNNIYSIIRTYSQSRTFKAKEMKVFNKKNVQIYLVKGNILYTKTLDLDEIAYFIVKIDNNKASFSIRQISSDDYKDGGLEYTNKEETSIDRNDYNTFNYYRIKDDEIAKNYLANYKEEALGYTQEAYEKLDEEYRTKRFGTFEGYKSYIEENREAIEKVQLSKYAVEEKDESKIYTCIDQYNNYYIFDEKSVMNYTLKLDTYTIMDDELQSEYNSSSNERKVSINISKFIKMINSKDYENSYELLSQNFRDNYFDTIEKYKKYIKENLFEYNNIEYVDVEKKDGIYIYKIKLTDMTESSSDVKEKDIIMQLGENYDFIMSFNI